METWAEGFKCSVEIRAANSACSAKTGPAFALPCGDLVRRPPELQRTTSVSLLPVFARAPHPGCRGCRQYLDSVSQEGKQLPSADRNIPSGHKDVACDRASSTATTSVLPAWPRMLPDSLQDQRPAVVGDTWTRLHLLVAYLWLLHLQQQVRLAVRLRLQSIFECTPVTNSRLWFQSKNLSGELR